MAAVLEKNPNAKGVLFDLASVLAGAPDMLKGYGVENRVEVVEGNFFEDVPVVADIFLLKHIIHDWYDDNNEKILRNIREVMPDNARVL